ncbi:MAG: hypothetical protein H8E66_28915 [Planctomycetes bacterium]|nr:hypothetical protein [Planctomycetota bacterium]
MTLVELMVVVTIAVLLIGVSVPMMKPAVDDAKRREASRQFNVFLTSAKARAIQNGRPAGVWVERDAAGGNAALNVYMAETPAPYSGDFISSTAVLVDSDSDGRSESADIDPALSLSLPFLVQAGDSIRFGYKGARFELVSVPPIPDLKGVGVPSVYTIVFEAPSAIVNPGPDGKWGDAGVDDDGQNGTDDRGEAGWALSDDGPNPPPPGTVVSFQIYRQPRRSKVAPLLFSGGVAIDLEYSGIGASGSQFDASLQNQPGVLNSQPVIVMFDPGGAVSKVYTGIYNAGTGTIPLVGAPVQGTIHFLLGKFDQSVPPPVLATAVSPTLNATQTNLEDTGNSWVSIADRTGAITTAENASGATLVDAREFVISGQGSGGI